MRVNELVRQTSQTTRSTKLSHNRYFAKEVLCWNGRGRESERAVKTGFHPGAPIPSVRARAAPVATIPAQFLLLRAAADPARFSPVGHKIAAR